MALFTRKVTQQTLTPTRREYPRFGLANVDVLSARVSSWTAQALEGFKMMCSSEGIIPALEPSHAVYHTIQVAKSMKPDQIVLLNLCGRGDKDMHTVAKAMGVKLNDNA